MRRLAIIALLFLFSCSSCKKTTLDGIAMGMSYKALFKKTLSRKEEALVKIEIDKLFSEIDATLNGWNEHSEISRWNKSSSTEPITVSPMIIEIAKLSDKAHLLSKGHFDPSIGKATRLWKLYHRVGQTMSEEERISLLNCCGWANIVIHERALQKLKPELELDFDGITKGYFCDVLSKRLQFLGFEDFLVEWGGEIKVCGGPFKILEGKKVVFVSNISIATSGPTYQHYYDSNLEQYRSHFITPCNLDAKVVANPYSSKSIQHKSCAIADALATTHYIK